MLQASERRRYISELFPDGEPTKFQWLIMDAIEFGKKVARDEFENTALKQELFELTNQFKTFK